MKIKKLNPNARIPKRATDGSAGYDLFTIEGGWIGEGQTKLLRTGISLEIPKGYEMVIRPRSGISLKTDLIVMIGTIDSDYRGEIGIIVKNVGKKGMYIQKNSRLAQAVFHKIEHFDFVESEELENTERGSGGFGSTGITENQQVKDNEALKRVIDEILANDEKRFKRDN